MSALGHDQPSRLALSRGVSNPDYPGAEAVPVEARLW